MSIDHLFDDDLEEQLQIAELESRCVTIGAEVGRVMAECGYEFDAATFVVGELVRAAEDRGVDAEHVIGFFEERGFVSRTVAALDAG